MAGAVISLTEKAAHRAKALMAKAEDNVLGLRVGVKSGGCSGMSYFVEYAHDQKKFEEVVEEQGVKIFVDPKAIMYLLGTQMDWVEEKFKVGFVFNNPNEADRCGCGESVSFKIDRPEE